MKHITTLVATVLFGAAVVASAGYYPVTSTRPTVELIGWDATAHRIFYLVTFPMYRTDGSPDSTRVLRWFDPDSATPQEPRQGRHVRVGSPEDTVLVAQVRVLQMRCASLDSVGAPGRAGVSEVGHHGVSMGDYTEAIHHLRISFGDWSGEYQTYAECNSLDLRVRGVFAVPGRDEAVAILDRPGRFPDCDAVMVMLLARHSLPIRTHDLSQPP